MISKLGTQLGAQLGTPYNFDIRSASTPNKADVKSNAQFSNISSRLSDESQKNTHLANQQACGTKTTQIEKTQPISNYDSYVPSIDININANGTNVFLDFHNLMSNVIFQITTHKNSTTRINFTAPTINMCGSSLTITISTDGKSSSPISKPLANETISRLAPADEGAKTGELSGKDRPAPRDVSNAVAAQKGAETKNNNNASDLLWSWGQFIDHDMVLTKEGEEHANIFVPKGDAGLDPTSTGLGFIPFERSAGVLDSNGVRQQINEQTPLIDGSMVYGATQQETENLRSHTAGLMKIGEDGFLLEHPDTMVLAGDKRAAEQPGLLSLQTLFVREHNRQAKIISQQNPLMSDDAIFQEARRIVTAEIQAITYNEFLPILLGSKNANPDNFYIDPKTNDGKVSNEFATAAYRLGHTLVSEKVAIKGNDGSIKQVSLDDVFFNPDFTKQEGIGSILSGQSEQTAEKVDNKMIDGLRNRLFGPPGSGAPGLDLASLNIQRGRDHNLPSYNDMRLALGLNKIESFDDAIFQEGVGSQLASVYTSPDDIDLWVGGLAENASGYSMLGETFTKIVSEQFAKTAKADANFYTKSVNYAERQKFIDLTLSDIIHANTENTHMDDTAFIVG